jgi:hypothetical protein
MFVQGPRSLILVCYHLSRLFLPVVANVTAIRQTVDKTDKIRNVAPLSQWLVKTKTLQTV